jgi:hypothetical protein
LAREDGINVPCQLPPVVGTPKTLNMVWNLTTNVLFVDSTNRVKSIFTVRESYRYFPKLGTEPEMHGCPFWIATLASFAADPGSNKSLLTGQAAVLQAGS